MRKLFFLPFLILFLMLGCGPKPTPGNMVAQYVTAATVQKDAALISNKQIQFSSEEYAVVRYDWLVEFNKRFTAKLNAFGVPANYNGQIGYSAQFDCVAFTDFYLSAIRMELATQLFGTSAKDRFVFPAAFAIWYFKLSPPAGPHAIVAVLTDRGWVFVEPQTSKFVQLSQLEKINIYHFRS